MGVASQPQPGADIRVTRQVFRQIGSASSLSAPSSLTEATEPPYTGPVCTVVWEGRDREVSPYPDYAARGLTQLFQQTSMLGA